MACDADFDFMALPPLVEDESASNTLKRFLAGVYFLLRLLVYSSKFRVKLETRISIKTLSGSRRDMGSRIVARLAPSPY
jgi:hypothetical protein